jgi:hypothetical protein
MNGMYGDQKLRQVVNISHMDLKFNLSGHLLIFAFLWSRIQFQSPEFEHKVVRNIPLAFSFFLFYVALLSAQEGSISLHTAS